MDDKEKLDKKLDKVFSDLDKQINATLNILVVGKVSAGKSSFLNAFFDEEKNSPKFKVGAKSGETTKVNFQTIGKNIKIADTPGLSDINLSNSDETWKIIADEGIDIGILIVSGSADASQREHYEFLKKESDRVFVVLNKSDNFSEENLTIVQKQWKKQLNLDINEKIYPVVSRGYDSKDKEIFRGNEYDIEVDEYGRPKTLRGIDTVRDDVLKYLRLNGKDILLAKVLKDKRKKAIAIISAACISAATSAFIPGSAIYIGAIQATAIASLIYLYTGKVVGKKESIAFVGVFVAENAGMELFLIVKSFLPPTGILDAAAASIALTITVAMLTAVAVILAKGYSLDDKGPLLVIFGKLKDIMGDSIKNAKMSDLKNLDFFKEIITKAFKIEIP